MALGVLASTGASAAQGTTLDGGGISVEQSDIVLTGTINVGDSPESDAPGGLGSSGAPVAVVRFRVLATGPDGEPCFEHRSIRVDLLEALHGTAPLAIDIDTVEAVIARDGLGPCPNPAPVATISAGDFLAPLEASGRQAVPRPTFTVQPGNRPLTGQPSYLDDGLAMRWQGPVALTFPGSDTFAPFTVTADVRAHVVAWWVDWDWDGLPLGDAPHGDTVTGPHTEPPRGWRDGNPGNIAWTWQQAGTHRVAVIQRWQVTADVPGIGSIGPVEVTGAAGEVTVEVRQAQPVRRS